MNAVEIKSFQKKFGQRIAVSDLSLSVQEGEVFGLLGRNGAGKSTTIKMMLGLVHPDSGSVRLLGHDLAGEHDQAIERVGSLVERPAFYDYLTGRKNLEILSQGIGAVFFRRAEELCDRLGIADRLDDKVGTYSQGMRQKLGIVLSMLPDSKLVVLDEPTNGLDPHGIREVRQFIQEMNEAGDVTIFLSSHLLSEVEQVCTSLAVLELGQTIAQGRLEELLDAENEVIIRIDEPDRAEQFLQSLDSLKVKLLPPDSIQIRLQGMAPAELLRRIVEAGFNVHELRQVRHTLEDYFLNLTEVDGDT